jgi:hypothetical protein
MLDDDVQRLCVGIGVDYSIPAVQLPAAGEKTGQGRWRDEHPRTGMVSWRPYNAEGVPVPTTQHSVYRICNRSYG